MRVIVELFRSRVLMEKDVENRVAMEVETMRQQVQQCGHDNKNHRWRRNGLIDRQLREMVLLVCLLKPENANEGGRNSGSFRFGISVSVENWPGYMSGGSVPIGKVLQLEWIHGGRRKTVMANSRESPKGPWRKGLTSVDDKLEIESPTGCGYP